MLLGLMGTVVRLARTAGPGTIDLETWYAPTGFPAEGQNGVEDEYQRAINHMGQSTLGAWSSTPRGILAGKSGLTPARALLNHRQARSTQRLYARSLNDDGSGDGPEEILTRERSDLAT